MPSASRLLPLALLPLLLHAQTGGNLSNCKGGCDSGESCIGNPFSQPVPSGECSACAKGQYWWPCNFETLCYCNSVDQGAPRVPPAPRSKFRVNDSLDPCKDILTEEIFNSIVQPTSEEALALYTYAGLCNAIAQYNMYHDEKFAGMGTEEHMRGELAAFLAHAAVDTHGYSLTREEVGCIDHVTGLDGKVYCKPCKEEHYDPRLKTCSQSYFAVESSYEEFCDASRQPPQGCACNNGTALPVNYQLPVDGGYVDLDGYILASDAYFTRGAIQISHNYDFYGASMSLTGDANFLCDNPDMVSTIPQYAWGAGIYKWMERMTFGTTGTTAHRQVMMGTFGGTVEVLYPELECPGNKWSSQIHMDMVKDRVAQVCKTGSALGVYLEMERCNSGRDCIKCEGLTKIFEVCQKRGTCPECADWIQFVKSQAPSVTPIRVASPLWDDWSTAYGAKSPASVRAPVWPLASSLIMIVFTIGPSFMAIF